MAKPTIQTGANSTLVYYWEDNGFKGSPNDSTAKPFGKDSELSAWSGSRNAVELFDPNSREVAEWIRQQFSGTYTADFVLGNPWWNRAVIAEAGTPTDNGDGSHTYEYNGEDPSSFQIVTGNTRSGEDWLLGGCVVANATVSIEVPGNVTISLDGAYGALQETEPDPQEAQVTRDAEAMTFADASLSIGGTVQRLIQSLTFTLANNTDMVLELGAEEPVDFSPKARMLTVDSVQTRDDASDDEIDRFLGGGETLAAPTKSAMVIDIDNGESGADAQRLKYDLTNALPNEFSVGGIGNPDSDVENSVTNRPVGVTAEATNDVETAP